jgi:hypothetical protein
MLKKVPPIYLYAIVGAILLSGPITAFSFLYGGINAGVAAILSLFVFFVAIYIVIVRKYGG